MMAVVNPGSRGAGGQGPARMRARLSAAGGLDTAANAIGLLAGTALLVGSGYEGAPRGVVASILGRAAGDPGAVALIAAAVIFLWSGALRRRADRDPMAARQGDLLSAFGGLALGAALLGLGHVALAGLAMALHALGRVGCAGGWSQPRGWRRGWPDFYRVAVAAGRVPAMLAAAMVLGQLLAHPEAAVPLGAFITPLTILVCCVLWSSADLIGLRGCGAGPSRRAV